MFLEAARRRKFFDIRRKTKTIQNGKRTVNSTQNAKTSVSFFIKNKMYISFRNRVNKISQHRSLLECESGFSEAVVSVATIKLTTELKNLILLTI